MKALLYILLLLPFGSFMAQEPDSTGMPGDNLNLYAVLELFKASKSVEAFEQTLNDPETHVNNLDLDHDGHVDYIRVVDYGTGQFHSLVLQIPITKTESQDVAVIEVEKKGNGSARIQIVGDEDLYGKNYIIEPQDQPATQAPAPDNGPDLYVNVWGWPCILYMYDPAYVFWVSPWYWGYYPSWWRPWNPYGYYAYRQWYFVHPHPFYHRIYTRHFDGAHVVYAPHRTISATFEKQVTVVKATPAHKKDVAGNSKATTLTKQPLNEKPVQKSAFNTKETTKPLSQKKEKQARGVETTTKQQQVTQPQPRVNRQPASQPVMKQEAPRVQQIPRMNAGGRVNGGGGGGRHR